MPKNKMLGTEVVRGQVLPEWIDVNNHMNVAYYVLVFDQGVDTLWDEFGLGEEYIENHSGSTFAVESHITWQREIAEADPYVVTSQVLSYDEKRIHQFMRMYHADEHFLAATAEWMNLHVDLGTRRVAPWPHEILKRITKFVAKQGEQAWPAEAGRIMNIDKPLFSAKAEIE